MIYPADDRRKNFGRTAGSLVRGLCFFILLWAGAILRFIADLPRQAPGPDIKTDGIVVFTGGPARIKAGVDLLSAGAAQKLLISGVHGGTGKSDIQMLTGVSNDLLDCCIDLGFAATDTTGNAAETTAWIKDNAFTSIRLVTAVYHIPRSLVELRRRIQGVNWVASPVQPPQFKLDRWWLWPGSAWLLFEEGNKYIAALARAQIDQWSGGRFEEWRREKRNGAS